MSGVDGNTEVTVPAAELTSLTPPGQPVLVTVTNPAPNAGTSSALPFSITRQGLVSINFDDGYQSMFDNGLPILEGNDSDLLEPWYASHVVGGSGAFLMPARGFTDFARAMRQKFLIEISSATPSVLNEPRPPKADTPASLAASGSESLAGVVTGGASTGGAGSAWAVDSATGAAPSAPFAPSA